MMNTGFQAGDVFRADLFKGQTVLITGGGSGIGRLIAEAFAELGANLVLVARNVERLQRAREELVQAHAAEVRCLACNIADSRSVDSMVADAFAWKEINILINNAGANSPRPTERLTPMRWKVIVDTVLNGTFYVTRAVGRRWIKMENPGCIINLASTTGWTGSPYMTPSGAAKAGVINMGRTLGSEWGKYGIRINDISPGPVFTKGSYERLWLNEEVVSDIKKRTPLGKFPTPSDVAGAAIFLASPAASAITGASLAIDGGESLKQGFGDLLQNFRPRRKEEADGAEEGPEF